MTTLIDDATATEQKTIGVVAPIDLARAFVKNAVQIPAMQSRLRPELKSKIKHSDRWLDRFNRVGDLLLYLRRFDVSRNDPMYLELKNHGLLTFEDILEDFSREFGYWAQDCSRVSDFVVGQEYSVYEILILARNYDTRAGGMFVLEANDKPVAVVIKATLSNGPYPNVWLHEYEQLKYYLKSISGIFGEHFKPNQAILQNKTIPIVTFTRDSDVAPFVFRGIFRYQDILHEHEGRKAFIIQKDGPLGAEILMESGYAQRTLERRVAESILSAPKDRLRRLANAKKRPTTYTVTTTAYSRNPDVIAEVLLQANGVCQSCNDPAPFLRRTTGTPYLEVHHRVPLAMGGEDTVDNAIALCPNCHRERHFGQNAPGAAAMAAISGGSVEEDLLDAITVKID